ncbi:MAG: Smr/MutS family protein [Bacilli bacterium]|nr:Smr/MutS family protein [Bacilli bacterium]
MFTSKSPTLDLHGEYCSLAATLINDFINDNIKMKNEYIAIVHGKSTGLMTRKTHEVLKSNKNVIEYYIHPWNTGMTVVRLKIK